MKLKVIGVDSLTTVELEAELEESFNIVGNRAGNLLRYHGNFTLKEENGAIYPPSQNLEDNEDFIGRGKDSPLYIHQITG